ncbi:Lrp/AsnC family transcriptional regulator [Kordiimonas marina]|uniref:Lrp/AsnC family transcriptional regulator n=1 Tax=Kordiimonas marina TaxID=2872312 RepID=UPI001FF2E6CF|nr:Lrp/AsnC family transcriptional regulator [Kordiimonas marina]MCJ9430611.1 Lrp/AsnC family transcriptional regulator [Kordiimonas marina]
MIRPLKWMAAPDWTLLSALMGEPTQHMFVGKGAEHQHDGDAQRLVRRLKKHHAYKGWRLEVDRRALGLGITAFIFIKLKRQSADVLDAFRTSLSDQEHVIRLHSLSGEFDFMLEFVGRHMADLNAFRTTTLNTNTLVKGTTTMISLEQ